MLGLELSGLPHVLACSVAGKGLADADKLHLYSKLVDASECPICMDAAQGKVVTACGHGPMCLECITQALQHQVCPLPPVKRSPSAGPAVYESTGPRIASSEGFLANSLPIQPSASARLIHHPLSCLQPLVSGTPGHGDLQEEQQGRSLCPLCRRPLAASQLYRAADLLPPEPAADEVVVVDDGPAWLPSTKLSHVIKVLDGLDRRVPPSLLDSSLTVLLSLLQLRGAA